MQTKSHLTQQLQNYFDINDVRVRQLPYSLDAQLLNVAAQSMEDHQLRYNREVSGRFLASCPRNLDNRGVYYSVQLPNSMPLSLDVDGTLLPPSNVVGVSNGNRTTLTPFQDTLSVPVAARIDPSRSVVPCSEPLLCMLTGTDVVSIAPRSLPIPNRLSFFVTGIGLQIPFIQILIEGEAHPRDLWPGKRQQLSEQIIVKSDGVYRTSIVWNSVSSIRVFGLPQNAVVLVYAVEMSMPCVPDPNRPYMSWDDRSIHYERFWQLDTNRLRETYRALPGSVLNDQPTASSIRTDGSLADMAVEPFTYGAFAVSEGTSVLHYFDRREPLPVSTGVSALTVEPNYGLYVELDETDPPRRVILHLQKYAKAGAEAGYRYSILTPDGVWWMYVQSGSGWILQPWTASYWAPGPPPDEVPFLLQFAGEYVFKLETRDGEGRVLSDATPFLDRSFTPLASLPLPVLDALGVGFDHAGQLWVWDGGFLQPIVCDYNGYAFDPATRTLYLTQQFDSVEVSA